MCSCKVEAGREGRQCKSRHRATAEGTPRLFFSAAPHRDLARLPWSVLSPSMIVGGRWVRWRWRWRWVATLVVTGFIGQVAGGCVTTLGRGGYAPPLNPPPTLPHLPACTQRRARGEPEAGCSPLHACLNTTLSTSLVSPIPFTSCSNGCASPLPTLCWRRPLRTHPTFGALGAHPRRRSDLSAAVLAAACGFDEIQVPRQPTSGPGAVAGRMGKVWPGTSALRCAALAAIQRGFKGSGPTLWPCGPPIGRQVWKDVDGMLTADPRVVPTAVPVSSVGPSLSLSHLLPEL